MHIKSTWTDQEIIGKGSASAGPRWVVISCMPVFWGPIGCDKTIDRPADICHWENARLLEVLDFIDS